MAKLTEPWLRGTHAEIAAIPRAAIHAIEQAGEDLTTWCAELTDEELNARPFDLPAIVFQLRHVAGSLDRLLTYAEGQPLNEGQFAVLKNEAEPGVSRAVVFEELTRALGLCSERIRTLGATPSLLAQTRAVGRKGLPTTVAGLLVHVAEHTQRHVGQAITTAKILLAQRSSQ